MTEQRFEYQAITLRGKVRGEVHVSQHLNEIAAHGWRLVQVVDSLAYFERPVRWED